MSDSVWVSKDASGNITGTYAAQQSFPVTKTTSDDPAVVAYLNPVPTLAQIRAAKVDSLRAACAAQIGTGATSSALGTTHVYPTDQTSQLNLAGSVTASLLPGLSSGWTTPFWCSDLSGNWSFAPHTAAQIQQVGTDVKAFVVVAQTKLAQLTASVNAAADVASIAAISW